MEQQPVWNAVSIVGLLILIQNLQGFWGKLTDRNEAKKISGLYKDFNKEDILLNRQNLFH